MITPTGRYRPVGHFQIVMKLWLRRLLILLFVLFWLAVILTPTLAFVLARNGQVQVGRTEGRHWRLFLLQDIDSEGLGLERGRPVAPPLEAPPSVRCLRTTVDYWLWTGDGSAADYCQCTDWATGDATDYVAPACALP